MKFSATVQQPVPGLLLKLGVTFSGSVMNILGAESGPAYSGPVAITVRVSDPFGLFAVQVLHLEFTREESPGSRRVTIEGITIPSSGCATGAEFPDQRFLIPEERDDCIEHVRFYRFGCGIEIFAVSFECLGDPSIQEKRAQCRQHFDAELPKCG